MKELKKKLKEIEMKTMAIILVETFVLSLFFSLEALWVLWGGIGAVIGFYSLAEEIKKMTVGSKPKKILPGFFMRYLLYGVILGIAAVNSAYALLLAFVGLINLKIVPFLSYK
ncbi:ATP synthase subunit I [Petrotoga olearia]|nr:ATP synthase subunit I [Petrotoga olearia]